MRCRSGASLLVSALLVAGGARAQATGSISGVVVDGSTMAPLAGAVATARGPALTGEQSAVTDGQGAFEIKLLPAGTYSLTVEHGGFQKSATEGLVVKEHHAVEVRLQMLPVPSPGLPLEFNDNMTAPVLISGPPPEYPQKAIERGVEGTMTIRCVVTVAGAVHGCRVIKSLPFMDRAVIDALERRKYKPALQAGAPVDIYYTFQIKLTLPSEAYP
jgi:TonB family protein